MHISEPKIISFQGALGANSDIACRTMFSGWDTLPCETFFEAFAAVQEGKASLAMIPIDNTLAGRVADVHHLLPGSGLSIIGEHFEPIRHALLAPRGTQISELREVYSHVHAIPQCRKIIKELDLTTHVHADTAGAARDVAQMNNPGAGAIASTLAAEIYGLDILKEDIQDENHNTTRFVVLSPTPDKTPPEAGKTYLTSMIFRVRNIPAALYKSMGGFATNGVNMIKLESYVDPDFQAAQFYAEVVGHLEDESVQLALDELRFYAAELNLFGSYEAAAFRKSCDLK